MKMNTGLILDDSKKSTPPKLSIQTIRDRKDILDLRYGLFHQGQGRPKQYVVFANGRTEWMEKYDYLPNDLQLGKSQGFLTWDHRGQGASGGSRAHAEDYGDFAADAAKIIESATHGQPYIVVTHSMGGLIILTAIMNGWIKPQALLMSSPLLGLPNKPVPQFLARPLARALTGLGIGSVNIPAVGEFEKSSFERNLLTSSADHFARLKATPYPCPSPTFGWLDATFRALEYCWDPNNLRSFSVPTMIMVGSEEQVVDLGAIKQWAQETKKISGAKVDLTVFEGAKHELFSEVELHYRKAIAVAQVWIREYLGG
jgi:alpha-beta hydrolase superfamily lysophospholipase